MLNSNTNVRRGCGGDVVAVAVAVSCGRGPRFMGADCAAGMRKRRRNTCVCTEPGAHVAQVTESLRLHANVVLNSVAYPYGSCEVIDASTDQKKSRLIGQS